MEKISEKEKQSRDTLFNLMVENPDLPVVPMVDKELVGDDYGRWMGRWGLAQIDEYLISEKDYEPMIFKSERDVEDSLERYLTDDEYEALPDSDDERKKIYDALPWVKAIIVNIDSLD